MKIYKKHKDVYDKVDKSLSPQWHQSFQKKILSSEDINDYLENDNIEKLEKKITDKFRELVDENLPKLMGKLNEELNDNF